MTRVRAVALLVVGCALAAAAASTGPFLERDRPVPPFAGLRRRVDLRPPRTRRRLPGEGVADSAFAFLDLVFRAVIVAVVLGVLAWGAYRLGRTLVRLARLRLGKAPAATATDPFDRGEESYEDAEAALRRRVADELRLLSADLDTEVEPREAVIACYVRMEAALADAGTPRAVTETPMELLRRVLDEYDVPAADVRRLTDLFTEARFSPHPVTDEMRRAARRSLGAVSDALAVRA